MSQKKTSTLLLMEMMRRCSSNNPNCEQCDYWELKDCSFQLMSDALKRMSELQEAIEKTKGRIEEEEEAEDQ